MSIMGVEHNSMKRCIEAWGDIAEKMRTLSGDMATYSTAGLPSSVTGVAATFLETWSGIASDSATIATDFGNALQAISDDYTETDELRAGELSDLDGSLR